MIVVSLLGVSRVSRRYYDKQRSCRFSSGGGKGGKFSPCNDTLLGVVGVPSLFISVFIETDKGRFAQVIIIGTCCW